MQGRATIPSAFSSHSFNLTLKSESIYFFSLTSSKKYTFLFLFYFLRRPQPYPHMEDRGSVVNTIVTFYP